MDIGSCKSAYNRINIVKKKNNFRIIVKIVEMGIFSYNVFKEEHCNNSRLPTDLIIAMFSVCKLSAVRGSVIQKLNFCHA